MRSLHLDEDLEAISRQTEEFVGEFIAVPTPRFIDITQSVGTAPKVYVS